MTFRLQGGSPPIRLPGESITEDAATRVSERACPLAVSPIQLPATMLLSAPPSIRMPALSLPEMRFAAPEGKTPDTLAAAPGLPTIFPLALS